MTPTPTRESLVVAECYGPTLQGEGPSIGRRASFLRLGGCDLSCTWCDSAFTWDASRFDLRAELTRRPVAELLDQLDHFDTPLIIITGGEPLLHQHQEAWRALLEGIAAQDRAVEVETNGTIAPSPFTTTGVDAFNVSPKLSHAGDPKHRRIRPEALAALKATGRAAFKFVCRDEGDLAEAQALVTHHRLPPDRVWIMPEGVDAATLLTRAQALTDPALAAGFNLTTRLHVLLWGNQRSR